MSDTQHQKNIKAEMAKCLSMIDWFDEQIAKQNMSLRLLEKALENSIEVESDE